MKLTEKIEVIGSEWKLDEGEPVTVSNASLEITQENDDTFLIEIDGQPYENCARIYLKKNEFFSALRSILISDEV